MQGVVTGGTDVELAHRAGGRAVGHSHQVRSEEIVLLGALVRESRFIEVLDIRRGEAAGVAGEHPNRPGEQSGADRLEVCPHRGEVVEAVAVEVHRREGNAEKVVVLGHPGDAGSVLGQELVAKANLDPAARAEEDLHRPGVDLAIDTLSRDADREVVEAVAIEVADGKGLPEDVLFLRCAIGGRPLLENLVAGRRQLGEERRSTEGGAKQGERRDTRRGPAGCSRHAFHDGLR